MKALFLIYHGFDPANGVSKKIHYQVNALKACGIDTRLCYLQETGRKKLRMIDSNVIADYGNGVKGKIYKRIEFDSIFRYVMKENINLIYIRSDLNANPFTINLVKKIHKKSIPIVMEIPTYPYDQEEDTFSRRIQRLIDKIYRHRFAKYLSRIITFSDFDTIFNIPTIRISNGIDFSQITIKQQINDTIHALHLIGVAEIHYWHGFDRLIKGLAHYYQTNPDYKVYFHLVGNFFSERERNEILPIIQEFHLENYVIIHGPKHGLELDKLFEQADMAIGSLARHRSGITSIKTLKNREYAARGFSFIYSEIDSDFEQKPYIMKVPSDESPIDIQTIIDFHKHQYLTPTEIRASILSLSWSNQMRKVLSVINMIHNPNIQSDQKKDL